MTASAPLRRHPFAPLAKSSAAAGEYVSTTVATKSPDWKAVLGGRGYVLNRSSAACGAHATDLAYPSSPSPDCQQDHVLTVSFDVTTLDHREEPEHLAAANPNPECRVPERSSTVNSQLISAAVHFRPWSEPGQVAPLGQQARPTQQSSSRKHRLPEAWLRRLRRVASRPTGSAAAPRQQRGPGDHHSCRATVGPLRVTPCRLLSAIATQLQVSPPVNWLRTLPTVSRAGLQRAQQQAEPD
mmetsp:Transcript_43708/g.115452  ORF Transcript_43708/g.115452 Transcript_43708/m.115452 type:complete len:241 (+) Transcript_43708:411-1133(+)